MRWLLLSLTLALVVILFTARWWGVPMVNATMPRLLRSVPVEKADVRVEQLGLAESRIEVTEARIGAISIHDATVDVEYAVEQLRRQNVDEIMVRHPQVNVDLAALLSAEQQQKKDGPVAIPDTFPLQQVTVENARIQLLKDGWEQTLDASARLTLQDRARFSMLVENDADRVSIDGVGNIKERTGQIRAKATFGELGSWLVLAKQLELPLPAEINAMTVSNIGLHTKARLENAALRDWHVDVSAKKLHAPAKGLLLDLEDAAVNASGVGLQPETIDAELRQGSAQYDQLKLNFSTLEIENDGNDALAAKLSGWSLKGKTSFAKLGKVSGSGGDLKARILGPWTNAAKGIRPADWQVELESASAPFKFFSSLGSLTGDLALSASIWAGETRSVYGKVEVANAEGAFNGITLNSERLFSEIRGAWPGKLLARLQLPPSTLTWGEGAGKLEGLAGVLDSISLSPLAISTPQTLSFERCQQGKLTASEGRVQFTYRPDSEPALTFELQAQALDGRLSVKIRGSPAAPKALNVEAHFDQVSLESLASLFPKFDGRVTGAVSGRLAFRLEGQKTILKPGYLQLTPNSTGRFQYYKQGWLTQDPNLNPEEYVKGKDMLSLMKDGNAATIVTELAMRDLLMTSFRLDVKESGEKQPVMIKLEGEGKVKEVTVPVILDIPVSGDVTETLNFALKLQSKM